MLLAVLRIDQRNEGEGVVGLIAQSFHGHALKSPFSAFKVSILKFKFPFIIINFS